jgi:16S rRNA G966 N2-methylase RsmD
MERKMSLIKKILKYMEHQEDAVELSQLYEHFDKEKHTTIRGRINESVGTKIIRTGRGRYLLLGAEIEAVIEKTDSLKAIPNILKSNIYYDLIFLDIPYRTGGQKGGNRDLSNYNLIEPEEFAEIVTQAEKMLKNENSQIYFMIAGGKSSKVAADKYIRAFDSSSLKVAGKGSYLKLNKNGTVCNMGKYPMPAEDIYVYSQSGKLYGDKTILDFKMTRPPLPKQGGYPTQKPFNLIEQIVNQSTKVGDSVLDLFGGSGVMLEACLKLKRFIHTMDISDDSINRMLKIAQSYTQKVLIVNNINYSNEQIMAFQSGRLF